MHKKHNETYSDSILISVMLLSVANTVSPEHNLNTHQFVKIKLHPYRYPIGGNAYPFTMSKSAGRSDGNKGLRISKPTFY